MTKNKFIKCLKIIAVLGPLVFNLLTCLIGSISAGNLLNFETITASDGDITGSYAIIVEAFVKQANTLCFEPYIGAISINANSSVPIFYMVANYLSETLSGVDIGTLIDATIPYGFCLGGSLCAISYYLFVEFVFFVPEVFILFIRWAKNLVYAFTRKGGFDA